MNENICFDSAWQNPDGTLKSLSRAELSLLSPVQRRDRKRAQNREYSRARKARYVGMTESQIRELLAARRARSEVLRARRTERERRAREFQQRREASRYHPAFPAPPGANVDAEIRLRILRMSQAGRRPICGIF